MCISISSQDPPHGKNTKSLLVSTSQEEVESDELRNESGELDKMQTATQATMDGATIPISFQKETVALATFYLKIAFLVVRMPPTLQSCLQLNLM